MSPGTYPTLSCMEKEDEVFLDAEEDFAPRRSGRKRRSTAGSTPSFNKKAKMPTRHSPRTENQAAAATKGGTIIDQEFWAKMGGMLGGLETRMKQETDEVKEQLGLAVDTIGQLGSRVKRAENRLDGLVDEVNSIVDRRLADRSSPGGPLAHEVQDQSYAAAAAAGGLGSPASSKLPKAWLSPEKEKEMDYWQCRNSLRICPIGQGDTKEKVKEYLQTHLKLSPLFMESVGSFSVSRVTFGPAAKIQGEVIVVFRSTEVRDAVKSAACNLAGLGSDYGVRLELPNHLKSSMRAIQSVSYDLKMKHPQVRRNVLFDDDTMDVVLDFNLSEDQPWMRLTSEQAKKCGTL